MNEKVTIFIVLNISTTLVDINNHMAVIQIKIDINTINDVLLDGGYGVNIITKQLK
jgi:hypothetical protein